MYYYVYIFLELLTDVEAVTRLVNAKSHAILIHAIRFRFVEHALVTEYDDPLFGDRDGDFLLDLIYQGGVDQDTFAAFGLPSDHGLKLDLPGLVDAGDVTGGDLFASSHS